MNGDLDLGIRSCLDRGSFALIGAGQLGKMTLDLWPHGLSQPKFFLDSTRRGKCRDLDVLNLQNHMPDPSVTYLLSAFKMSADQARKIFADLGQEPLLTVYDFFEHYSPSLFSNGWRCLNPAREKLEEIDKARRCFADAHSQNAFDSAVAWRYRRELSAGFAGDSEEDKYNLAKYGKYNLSYDLVYDCGAYDLSFATSLAKARVKFSRYVAFEPDPVSHNLCVPIAEALSAQLAAPVTVEKTALSNCDGEMPFVANGLLSARLVKRDAVAATNAIIVKTECLDNYHLRHFGGLNVQNILVKLHIEGAELSVLRGAVNMIDTLSLDIFVNLSHDEASLVEIPLLLAETNRYDLYLRAHSLFGEGLTLFARHKSGRT